MSKHFQELTRTKMRALKSGKKITESGIVYERLPNGDARFSVNIMVDGVRIHRTIGRESEGVTRKQAEDYIAQLRTDSKHGRLNLPKGRKMHMGFSDAVDKYLKRLEESNGRDIKSKRHRLRDHLIPFFGNKPLSKISSFEVDRYKKARQEDKKEIKKKIKKEDGTIEIFIEHLPYQAGTINRELLTLSHLLTKAVEWRWIDFKPCIIKQLKESPGRITYLTVEQAQRLLECARNDDNPHIYLFILIGLETAMRRSEIFSIRIEHINLSQRSIYIPKAKAGAREQPITNNLANYLEKYLSDMDAEQEWLFPAPKSKTGHIVAIEKSFRRVVTAAGLDPKEVVRHTLRHTAISHLVQAGVDLPTVKRISGHHTLQMIERYSHQNGTHIQAAMDKLEQRYQFR